MLSMVRSLIIFYVSKFCFDEGTSNKLLYTHIFIHLYTCNLNTCTPVQLYTPEHLYMCTHKHLYAYTVVCPYTCTSLYTHIPIHLHTFTPKHLYTWTPIHLYTYTPGTRINGRPLANG